MTDLRGQGEPRRPTGATGAHDLVVVTHRLPVGARRGPDADTSRGAGPGHVPGGPDVVMGHRAGAWVGSGDPDYQEVTRDDAGGVRLVPVPLSPAEIAGYEEGMANATLWPLYHDVVAPPEFYRPWWDMYVRVNRRFAFAAARQAALGATVWVHDYQLQLVPGVLREIRPDLRVTFFSHVPFPPYKLFAQLPWRHQIVEGLLGADLLGFQRPSDAEDFLNAAGRCGFSTDRTAALPGPQIGCVLAAGGRHRRTVRVAAFPTSVDACALESIARDPAALARARQIRAEVGDPDVLLLGVDRLDHTAGILHRFKAISELYGAGGFGAREASFIQVVLPTAHRDGGSQGLRQEIETFVARINGKHAGLGRPAVHYLYRAMPRRELAALYLAADVLLVTALRDGMNLVAKEYVASRYDECGALVLSEFAGASLDLPQAFVVNPHDIDGLKASITAAAGLPPGDAVRRMRAMREQVFRHDVGQWATDCLAALERGPSPPRGSGNSGGARGADGGPADEAITHVAGTA